MRQVQDIVQCPHLQGHAVRKSFKVKLCFAAVSEWTSDKPRQDDGSEVATTVGRQRLLTTGIGGADRLHRSQVVISVDLIKKQDARLRKVVGRAHDRVPKLRRSQCLVDPHAIFTLMCALKAQVCARVCSMHQVPRPVMQHGIHEGIAHRDGHVEVVPTARRALGRDELHHIWVVNAQHTHLRAAPRARTLYRGA